MLVALLPAQASTFIGNGGDILYKNGAWYLLDLVEAGLDVNVALCVSKNTDVVKKEFPELNWLELRQEDWNCLAQAIDHISEKDAPLAKLIEQVAAQYGWFIIDEKLKESNVVVAYVKTHGKKMATAANRHQSNIAINHKAWKSMHPIDRAALIFHEIFYATAEAVALNPSRQEPVVARGLTGQVFQFRLPKLELRVEMSGDHFNEPLEQGEIFQPTRFVYPAEHGSQFGVFFRRIKALPNGKKELSIEETRVRKFYDVILNRPAADYEAYYWVNKVSQMHYGCTQLLDTTAAAKELSDKSVGERRIIVDRYLSLMGLDPIKDDKDATGATISKHGEAFCKWLKPIVLDQ